MAILEKIVTERNLCQCDKCAFTWLSHPNKIPSGCPKCRSRLWDRPRKQRKLGKNAEKVIKIIKANPYVYNAKVGQTLGISRERVRSIRKNLYKRRLIPLPKRVSSRHGVYCLNCGAETLNQMYCCRACENEYTHPFIECHQCGVLFRRAQSALLRNKTHFFHNKGCQAAHIRESRWEKVEQAFTHDATLLGTEKEKQAQKAGAL